MNSLATSAILTSPRRQRNKRDSLVQIARSTLLEAGELPLATLAEMARREGQSTRPIYRVHRWFARRLSTQFRAILAAVSLGPDVDEDTFWERYNGVIPLEDALVLDPFVGGGTTLVEASRCGARVIGYDIDPVATSITRYELAARTRHTAIRNAIRAVEPLADEMRPYHQTTLKERGVEVLHHFWVEVATCPQCKDQFELHPHYQLAWDKSKKVQWAFCKHTHEIQELPLNRVELRARDGRRTRIQEGTLRRGTVVCPHCGHTRRLGENNSTYPPIWRLFAQEVLLPDSSKRSGYHRVFKSVTDADRSRYAEASHALREIEQAHGVVRPTRPIPKAPRFDRRPLLHGIARYDQLFNDRQLLHLTILGHTILAESRPQVKEALALAFSEHLTTCCMYTGYAFGYRRTSPLFSLHGFRHVVRPVELNPWLDGIGRGTFLNALRKQQRGARYAQVPTDIEHTAPIGPSDGAVATSPGPVLAGRTEAAICTGSSAELVGIPDGSVDLVLTDPPYLDNVPYSELSDFYLAWRQQLGVVEAPYDQEQAAPLDATLATVERSEPAVAAYAQELTTIFRSCHRVLRDDGLMVFTYHHKDPLAWAAVGEALVRSGFYVTRVLPMRGEGQGGLHTKAGTIKWDAVVVCRPTAIPAETVAIGVTRRDIQYATSAVRHFETVLHDSLFRDPDKLNYARALTVSRASAKPGLIPLREALNSLAQASSAI
ncbi:MAG: DNA methyltransferase [Bacteroidota bacterium]